MADPIDISGMPDPTTIGLAPPDPTASMPTPAQLFKQHKGYDAPAQGEIDEFMRNPDATPPVKGQKSGREGLSMLTGLPRAAAGYAAAVPAGVASVAGQASGALGAALDPADAVDLLTQGRDRGRAWSAKVNNLANYVPATKEGAGYAAALMNAPADIIKGTAGAAAQAALPDNAYQAVSDVAQDIGTDLPALGAPGVVRAGARVAGKAAGAAKGAFAAGEAPTGTTFDQAGNVQAPTTALKPDVDTPVTGDTLRAQPNPIPAEGTIHNAAHPASLAPEAAGAAPTPPAPAPTFESPDAETGGTTVAAPTEIAAPEPSPSGAPQTTLPETDTAPLDMSQTPEQRAIVREGVAARRAALDSERGSAQLFNQPSETGPQATPEPAQQSARAQHLNDIDQLSGGMLPSRRASAISGDYNATGDDYQLKEVGSEPMRQQLASENDAMHAATENVHTSVGSQFSNSVDPQTLSDRGRVTRGAIQNIQDFFQKATDQSYDAARANSGDRPMPNFLGRVDSFLKDDANYMPEGFRKSAQARLNQLKTAGDNGVASGSTPAAPSSVAAAEKFREWLNQNRTLDNMHTVRQMVDHTDTDVAEHGGPGLFATARNARRQQFQMLEEPTGIKKLLAPADSQGINHAIPEHKVMDYIADLPREQHEHVLKVLRAGAHLGGGELANDSAGAIREIQAHMISRMHDAATNADGTWNARKFYNQASSYAPKLGDTFRDQPKTLKNLQTINRAGNTLSMDKHYPGGAAQAERTGLGTAALKGAGYVASSVAHDIPLVGRLIGRGIEGAVEGVSEKGREAARDKAAMSRLVDRTGKERGSVQLFNDNKLNRENNDRLTFHGKSIERNPRTEYNANSQLAGGRQRLSAEQNDIIGRLGGGKQRGAVGDLSQRDAIKHETSELPNYRASKNPSSSDVVHHRYSVPSEGGSFGPGGQMHVTEYPERGVSQVSTSRIVPSNRGQGWGTRMLQRAADDAHARGQVLHSDAQVSYGAAGAYSNLKKLGYDVKMKDADHAGGAYHAVGDHVFEVRPGTKEYQAPKELEDFIKKSAPPHRIDESGPSNWEELQARRHEPVMPINPQGGEGSIYKDVPTNMAFRAWHDKTHLDVNGGFDHDGELATAKEQLRQAQKAGLSEESQKALWADTWETFKHHENTGEFPKNPRQFVAQRMKDPTPLGERVAASKQRGSVKVMSDAEPEKSGSMLNVGLHQGKEGEPGFKKMSKQQAQGAVESTGAKVTKNTVLMPKPNGPFEPTSVMSTDRPLSHDEMQRVLAKTKQSAIPQRTDAGETSTHVAPGHEETAAKEGWSEFSPDYFREHNGQSMSERVSNPNNIHPGSTVKNPTRTAYPGIYDDPKEIASRVQTSPESKHLQDIFGTTRQQMHDEVVKQGDVEPKTPMPGIAPKAKGSLDASRVTTPANAERLRDTISAFKDAHPEAYKGMVSWYHMDPMYQSIKKILGGDADRAGDVFHKLNTYTSLSSPMTSVEPEIRRGTMAAEMAAEGKFNQFAEHGGNPTSKAALKKAPELRTASLGAEGHAFHSTSQAPALTRFNEYGEEARAPKTGAYRRASDAASRPGSDYQNTVMVGDSHFSRGVGLADVRGAQHYDGSISGPELKTVAPWYHENVAKPLGIPATSAQASQWAALSHETGVETAIGAPKLEIWANEIAKAAHKAGVEPKEMWQRIVKRLAK